MRVEEFKAAAKRWRIAAKVKAAYPLFLALIPIFIWVAVIDHYEANLRTRFSPTVFSLVFGSPMIAFFAIGFALALRRSFEATERYAVACPHCNRNLAHRASKVISSKYCLHCGKRVLEDV